ncbi:PD-(D/E)XK nuclease family protein [Streptomyces albulus]|nr:PD-(D/E)XK nuclease family protein [Streptomyces noursei]
MLPSHRSWSQLSSYERCPQAFYLERIKKAWQRPAAWLPQGLGVHEAAEAYEKSGRTMSLDQAQDVFADSYQKHTNRLAETTPDFDFWFCSGPYKGEQDIKRRYSLGYEQTAKYVDYYDQHSDEVIWIDSDGNPAIELGFRLDLDGVEVVGYIDQVLDHPKHGTYVRDIKTGNKPGGPDQLKLYAMAVEDNHGQAVSSGDFWMGRTGRPGRRAKLDEVSAQELVDRFGEMDQAVKAERFDPAPEPSKCAFCPVSLDCAYVQ